MRKRAEEKAIDAWAVYEYREHPKGLYHTCFVDGYKGGYEQAEKDAIQRIKELLKVRIVERTERCQEDWSNRQKDRVNIRNDEDEDIIRVLEKLEEE